jgi:hypothetical protein
MNKMFRNLVNQLKRKKVIRTVRIVHRNRTKKRKPQRMKMTAAPPTFKNPQYHIKLEGQRKKTV